MKWNDMLRWKYIKPLLAFMSPVIFICTIGFPYIRWIGIIAVVFWAIVVIATIWERRHEHS